MLEVAPDEVKVRFFDDWNPDSKAPPHVRHAAYRALLLLTSERPAASAQPQWPRVVDVAGPYAVMRNFSGPADPQYFTHFNGTVLPEEINLAKTLVRAYTAAHGNVVKPDKELDELLPQYVARFKKAFSASTSNALRSAVGMDGPALVTACLRRSPPADWPSDPEVLSKSKGVTALSMCLHALASAAGTTVTLLYPNFEKGPLIFPPVPGTEPLDSVTQLISGSVLMRSRTQEPIMVMLYPTGSIRAVENRTVVTAEELRTMQAADGYMPLPELELPQDVPRLDDEEVVDKAARSCAPPPLIASSWRGHGDATRLSSESSVLTVASA